MQTPTQTIPAPDPGKPPLKANVFSRSRSTNTALNPLFPYLGDGDMVPAITLFYGGEGRETGVFTHRNTVDEVIILFGVRGAHARAGDVFVGGREHIVRGGLDDPSDPNSVMLVAVTQRQAEPGNRQHEALIYACQACQNVLLEYEFDARAETPPDAPDGYEPGFTTITEQVKSLDEFNRRSELRTCSKCGKVNDRFPIEVWGWNAYRDNLAAAEISRKAYIDSAAEMQEA